jgi:hypothetical protein
MTRQTSWAAEESIAEFEGVRKITIRLGRASFTDKEMLNLPQHASY